MLGRVQLDAVIFDLGGVVLGWEPERAFEQVMPAEQVAEFLARIDFADWNRRNDGGRRFDEAEAELITRFPDAEGIIHGYRTHFAHTLSGMVPGTSAVIAELGSGRSRVVGARPTGPARRSRSRANASASCAGSPASWCPATSAC